MNAKRLGQRQEESESCRHLSERRLSVRWNGRDVGVPRMRLRGQNREQLVELERTVRGHHGKAHGQ